MSHIVASAPNHDEVVRSMNEFDVHFKDLEKEAQQLAASWQLESQAKADNSKAQESDK